MASSLSSMLAGDPSPEQTHITAAADIFDNLPDPIILTIFNNISDIKTLIRCRVVSRRFNSLVPQSDSLTLRVDRVINSVDSDDENDPSPVMGFIKSIVKSIHDLISVRNDGENRQVLAQNSPAVILREFERIKELVIELPNGDLRLEKRAGIKWKAEFGKSLKSCVILGFRCGGVGEGDLGGGGGLKTRVVWTISSLIAASARHFMVREIVKDNVGLKKLVVMDKEGEGVVVMNEFGINEFRGDDNELRLEGNGDENEEGGNGNLNLNGGVWWRSNRTRVPAVWMRMRHEARLELSNGVILEGATLVVVRPTSGSMSTNGGEEDEERWDEVLVSGDRGLFEGVYGEAVAKLIKRRSYLLEMNSF